MVSIHEVCRFGERAALFDPDDRAAHDVFHGNKVRTAVRPDDLLDYVRFGHHADYAVVLIDQHTADVAGLH
jgi:hypothetical protein